MHSILANAQRLPKCLYCWRQINLTCRTFRQPRTINKRAKERLRSYDLMALYKCAYYYYY